MRWGAGPYTPAMRGRRTAAGNARVIGLIISVLVLVVVTVIPALTTLDAEVAPRRGAVPPPPREDESASAARSAAARAAATAPIARAVRWLESQQRADGSFPSARYDRPGATAIVCWIVLESTGEARRPSVVRALAWLREHADPARRAAAGAAGPYGNYDAAATLVALFHHYRLTATHESSPRLRAALTPGDQALVARLARYCLGCAAPDRWGYAAAGPAGSVSTSPRPEAAGAEALRDPAVVSAVPTHHRRYWNGDNSNAGYGWMALRAASMLGVRVADDAFVTAELERLLATRITTGVRRTVRVTHDAGSRHAGFHGMWPVPAWEAEVDIGGWSYAHGTQIPAMSASTAASLLYCWQEASERALLDDARRRRSAAAVLGALGSLRVAADPAVFCLY